MNRQDTTAIIQEIYKLNIWKKAAKHNWALLSQTHETPYLVKVELFPENSPNLARIIFFDSLRDYRDYLVWQQRNDFSVALTQFDFNYTQAVFGKNNTVMVSRCSPGCYPVPLNELERKEFSSLLYECYGLLMRLEVKEDLLVQYAKEEALFARKEIADNIWVDGPVHVPKEEELQIVKCIKLEKDGCNAAKKLPVYPKWIVEVACVETVPKVPAKIKPQKTYALVAVSEDMKFCKTIEMDGKPDCLERMWSSMSQTMLEQFLAIQKVPGEVHVASMRMMQFLRPLSMHLGFKLVRMRELPLLSKTIAEHKEFFVGK